MINLSKYIFILLLGSCLVACDSGDVTEGSIWMICDRYEDICDSTHSGALCSIERNDAIRTMAVQRVRPSSINAYQALGTLDDYKECLENAYVSQTVRNKADKQSQVNTIRLIPELQKAILETSRSGVRPEVNLWLWQRTQRNDYLESMRNGVELAEEVHQDVYIALMFDAAERDLEKARTFARKALAEAVVISDIAPRVYEFYVGYHLETGDFHKAAIWQGLYSARDEEQASVNRKYFKLYEKMSQRQIDAAQSEVDELLFDARWLNKSMDAFPKKLI